MFYIDHHSTVPARVLSVTFWDLADLQLLDGEIVVDARRVVGDHYAGVDHGEDNTGRWTMVKAKKPGG